MDPIVILDPLPKNVTSQHDIRLEEILNAGPPSTVQNQTNFKNKALNFCISRIGIAFISGLLFFILLLRNIENISFKTNANSS